MEDGVTRPPDRIRVRRSPKKGRYERDTVEAILDRALVAPVAFLDRGEPVCIPMLYARVGGKLYIHGSRASRAMRLLARAQQVCVTVAVIQGTRAGALGLRAQRELRIGSGLRPLRANRGYGRAPQRLGSVHRQDPSW